MVVFYSLLIFASAFVLARLASAVIRQVLQRGGFDLRYLPVGVLLVMTGFLMVVSMPASVLIAVFLLAVAGLGSSEAALGLSWRTLLPIAMAALLGILAVQEAPGAWPIDLPLAATMGIVWVIFFGLLLMSNRARLTMAESHSISLLALLPMALTPVLYAHAHTSLAMDAGIIIAALAGGVRYADHRALCPTFFVMPLAMLITYLAVQAVRYDAAPMAMLSILIWLIGIFVVSRRKEHRA